MPGRGTTSCPTEAGAVPHPPRGSRLSPRHVCLSHVPWEREKAEKELIMVLQRQSLSQQCRQHERDRERQGVPAAVPSSMDAFMFYSLIGRQA